MTVSINDLAIPKEVKKKTLTTKCIKFGYLNARSVNNKSSEISVFIDDNKHDICAITESWLTTGDEQITTGNLTPEGYKLHHVPRDKGRGGWSSNTM